MLFLQMLRERGIQIPQGPQGAPNSSGLEDILRFAKKAKGAYDDGQKLYNAGSAAYNAIWGPTYTPATQQLWNEAAGQASQQAWNAGANAASGAGQGAAEGGSQAASEGAGGSSADGSALAAAVSVYNSTNRFLKTPRDEQKAYEVSMAVPRAVAAYYTFGGSEMLEGFARKQWGGTMKKFDKVMSHPLVNPTMGVSKLWTSDKWKTEGNRLKGLIDRGINIPEEMRAAMYQTRGRKKSELINPYLPQDFRGDTPQYGWVNNKFANSRNEADLTARDIWGYSTFFDKFGNDWLGKMNEKQREAIANKALERGAVREHHGTIDINWSPELEADIASIRGPNMIPKAQPGTPQPGTPQAAPAPQPQTTPTVQGNQVNRKGILGRLYGNR
jgi:hypothetical protein